MSVSDTGAASRTEPPEATGPGGMSRHAPADEVDRIVLRRVHVAIAAAVLVLVVVAVAVSLAGAGWAWTGLPANSTLWDWLHLLVLPLVLLLLPLWVRTRVRLGALWRTGFAALAVGFAVLVVGGYAGHWAWTGFTGNRLWDWLQLLVLPVSVALLPLWLDEGRALARRHAVAAATGTGAFAVLVLLGYVVPWLWTGFEGNTLWDWVNLFVVPFLIPTTVVVLRHQTTLARARSGGDQPAS